MRLHELKTDPVPFAAAFEELKPFEVRRNDRDFQVEDIVLLREWSEATLYTGAYVLGRITYVTKGGAWGLPEDLCVFGYQQLEAKRTVRGSRMEPRP